MLASPLKPEATKTDSGALAFIFEKLLSEKTFIEIVTVVASNPTTQTIDVKPLVCRADPYNNSISNNVVYGVTYLRWQCGGSAIVMDPVVGDIGLLLVTDRDSSAVRLSRLEAQPTTKETHSRSDGIYLGGLLNIQPAQFIELKNGSINITTPDSLTIFCKEATVKATEGIILDTPIAKFTGDIIDNANSNASTLKDLREKFNAHHHTVTGVESGSSQVDSDKPNNPTE